MSSDNTNNEARIGLSLLNAGLAEFSDAVKAALQARKPPTQSVGAQVERCFSADWRKANA